MPFSPTYRPDPRFAELGEGFFDPVDPARFPRHELRFRNQRWAERVGLGDLDAAEWERHFAAFEPLPQNLPRPLALRYHGHQFGVYNPHLGDGRGFLFAQVRDAMDQRLLDLGTKGSGQTPWSRGGDGRLTLKGGVREVLATEMLAALGVNTSKSLSLFETGEMLFRGDEPSPTRSSVLVRLSHGHVRFGSFQRHAYHGDIERLRRLLEFSVEHYCPGLREEAGDSLAVAFLREVCRRSAELAASYIAAGFVHGVLNTDNLNITGESFDYGPYRFLPTYDPAFVAAYFDHTGLYAFARQPRAIVFCLTRLADALRPLAEATAFAPILRGFEPAFEAALERGILRRLGLASHGADEDALLVSTCFEFLHASQVGFDRFFFDWYGGAASAARALAGPAAASYQGAPFEALRKELYRFSPTAPERLADAYFQGESPESLLIDEIEAIWDAIAERDDWSLFEAKIAAIRAMGAAVGVLPA
jgi:serine/tyrosine/threonine adenylyltransferase